MKRKFTRLLAALGLLALFILPTTGWGQNRATKTEGFGSQATNTSYQGTVTITEDHSDCGIGWTIYYGNVASTSTTNNQNACLMRYYSASPSNLGYAQTTTGVQGLSNISFKAKNTDSSVKMGVWYSTDNSTWTSLATGVALTTSFETKSYDIPNSSTSITYYIKIGITTGSTNKKDLIIDDVVFTYSTGSTPTTYTVTYNDNGATSGDVPEDNTEYNSGDEVTVPGNPGDLAKTHYSFGGWCKNTAGTGTIYGPAPLEPTFEITSNTTLYAKWNPNTNTVTLPANDQYGTYTMDATNPVAYGTTVNLTYTPASGYESYAATWSVNGSAIEGNSFTMPDQAVNVTVELEQVIEATFIFNTDAGLAALGIEKPSPGAGTNLVQNQAYSIGNVSMTTTYTGTETRVWNNNGNTDLRVYSGGSLTFSVPNGVLITNITFECASGYVLDNWTNNNGQQTVTFEPTAQKRIYTITVAYSVTSGVLPPTFSPVAGTYNANQSVEISCTTNGAIIHYTTNGDTPTTSSTLYEGAITVDRNMTIKAIAIKDSQTSEPAEAQYVLTPLAPTFNPVGGPYTGTQTVTIECGTTGATLSYKLGDGDWTAYTEPVEVSATTTLYAKAHKDNWTDSESSATYTITQPLTNIAALTANSEAGSYLVTLSDAVVTYVNGYYAYIQDASGAVLYYKNGHGLTAGKTFNGTATVTYGFNYGNPQITAISGVTPADGPAPDPTSLAASSWNYTFTDVISQYIQITGATLTKPDNYYYVSLGGESIQLYKRGTALGDLDLTKTYTITGFPTIYVNGTTTKQELTIFVAPEEEVVPEAPVWSTLPQNATVTLGTAYEIDLSTYVSGTPDPTITIFNTEVSGSLYTFDNGSLSFTPIAAGTYSFTFTATNSAGSANATLTITAEAGAVPVLTVGELTATTAAVSWTECSGVTSYTLEIAPYLICESFENGILSTWTNGGVINPSGKGGDGTYCIGFNASGDYLITPALNNPKSISFMYKRSSNTTDWSLDVSYANAPDASEWNNIGTIDDATTSWQTFSASLNVTGPVYIRLKDTRSSGTHERYVDLIQITGNSSTTSESGLSHTFTGLSSGTKYTARVKGNGDWSNVVNFTIPYAKQIQAYTQNAKDNYYLIASPIGDVEVTSVGGMTAGEIDLYLFDQSEDGAEWQNYEATPKPFTTIESGKGYLYASASGTTLYFYGQPYNGNGKIDLVYDDNASDKMKGWNLIGNPFPCTAYLADGRDFYRMNAAGDAITLATDNAINVCEGIFVYVTSEGNVTFTTTDPATVTSTGNNNSLINLTVSQAQATRGEATVIDAARIRVNNGSNLPKFTFQEGTTKLYIPQGNKDYAVVNAEARGEMPVNFKATENGTYTISVEAENLDVNYLHLIDNITGMDVDLLATPSYTFEGKRTDYASRFRLVFDANAGNNDDNEEFAFISDGNIVITNNGEATLQVIDMLGRIVSSQTVNGNASIDKMNANGVYVLRLINGNNVKTQKIVVK